MKSQITYRVYIGDIGDGHDAHGNPDWITINLLEKEIADPNGEDYYLPILIHEKNGKWKLDWNKVIEATDLIEKLLLENPDKNILVHCGAGQERSPLVAQYYLVRYGGMNAQQAIGHIQKIRPQAIMTDRNYRW